MEVSGQQCQIDSAVCSRDSRRSANYKPSIWKHDFLLSLSTPFHEEEYKRRAEMLKGEVQNLFNETVETRAKLELVDCIRKLGLSSYFVDEIKISLDTLLPSFSLNPPQDLYITALSFKLLRLHGYRVSQDVLNKLINETSIAMKSKSLDIGGIMELLEASHLAQEGETVLEDAKILTTRILKGIICSTKGKFLSNIAHTLEIPSHWRAEWFDVEWQIHRYELEDRSINKPVINLAKLNFNIVQATLQKDLKDLSRWWRNLGLIENLNFSRDRLVESFLCGVGLGFEPKHSKFRKWLTKVVLMILVIDDVYDIFGSLEELEIFTKAIHRWEITDQLQDLPKCMQLCLEALCNMTNEIAHEIHTDKGIDFAKTQTHLKNAAEQKRGDAGSSIICYMREMNVSEEAARNYIKGLINNLWKKIIRKCFTNSTNDDHMKLFVNISTNMARVAHNLYHNGDGFAAQGHQNKKQILSLLVYPLNLD